MIVGCLHTQNVNYPLASNFVIRLKDVMNILDEVFGVAHVVGVYNVVYLDPGDVGVLEFCRLRPQSSLETLLSTE